MQNLLFFNFFFLCGFFFTNIQDWQDSWGRRRLCLYILSIKSHLLYRHLDISRLIAAERQPLATGLEPGRFGFLTQVGNHWATRSLEFALSTLGLVAAVVRRMLKTLVTLGNISRVLLNLVKRLIFVTFKHSSHLPTFKQLTFIFSLLFTNYDCFLL